MYLEIPQDVYWRFERGAQDLYLYVTFSYTQCEQYEAIDGFVSCHEKLHVFSATWST